MGMVIGGHLETPVLGIALMYEPTCKEYSILVCVVDFEF